jgi:hypothetical protein
MGMAAMAFRSSTAVSAARALFSVSSRVSPAGTDVAVMETFLPVDRSPQRT